MIQIANVVKTSGIRMWEMCEGSLKVVTSTYNRGINELLLCYA